MSSPFLLFCILLSLNAAEVGSPFEEHMTGTPRLQWPAAFSADERSANREGSAFSPLSSFVTDKREGRKPFGLSLNSSAHP